MPPTLATQSYWKRTFPAGGETSQIDPKRSSALRLLRHHRRAQGGKLGALPDRPREMWEMPQRKVQHCPRML